MDDEPGPGQQEEIEALELAAAEAALAALTAQIQAWTAETRATTARWRAEERDRAEQAEIEALERAFRL
jgi:hypothetical protein